MVHAIRQEKPPLPPPLRQALWLLGFDHAARPDPGVDLPVFVRHHGVAGMLDGNRVAQCPSPISDTLRSEQLLVTMRALHLSATLARVSARFSACGIRHAAIKGPALAQQLYGRTNARGGLDVDIMVAAESWPRATTELAGLGFRSMADPGRTPAHGTHELVFKHDSLTDVELHRRLLRRYYALALDWGPATIDSIELHGVPVPTLAPTFALPYLAAHANQHLFRRLIWLVDILKLLRHRQFDAEQAAWLSCHTDLGGAVAVCLTLLEHLFEAELPVPLQRLQRRSWARDALVKHAIAAMADCHCDREAADSVGLARRVAIDIGLQETLRGRVQALGDWLSPTERDQSWLALPHRMRFFYPAIRLARLLVQRPRR